MLILHQATSRQLSALLDRPERSEIDGLLLLKGEEVAPRKSGFGEERVKKLKVES